MAVLVSTSAMLSRGGLTTSTVLPSVLPVLNEEIARKERRNVAINKERDITSGFIMQLVPSSLHAN